MEPTQNPSKTPWALGVVCLLLLLSLGWSLRQTEQAQTRLAQAQQLETALRAEMVVTKNALGQETATKRSLQTNVQELQALKGELSASKQELLRYVTAENKKHPVIAATVIKQQVQVAKIESGKPVAQTDSSVTFRVQSDSLSYEAQVQNITARKDSLPRLTLRNLSIPNTASVSFSWGTKQEGYPVSVSVTNSNPLFHTSNIESVVIPELKKETLRPTLWEKIGTGVKVNRTPFLVGVGAGVVGALLLSGALH
jgi:type II secretory pathway component PulJ